VQRENEPQNPQKLTRKLIPVTIPTSPAMEAILATNGLMHSAVGLSETDLVA